MFPLRRRDGNRGDVAGTSQGYARDRHLMNAPAWTKGPPLGPVKRQFPIRVASAAGIEAFFHLLALAMVSLTSELAATVRSAVGCLPKVDLKPDTSRSKVAVQFSVLVSDV
jgi:hypothetical protein